MNHQPYEDWLFAEEPLSPQEQQSLQAHLRECESCQALSQSLLDLEGLFKRAPQEEPQIGFVSRWQERLEADRQRLHRRQSLAILGFSIGGAALLFASLAILTFPILSTPTVLFWSGVYRLLQVFANLDALRDWLAILTQFLPASFSPIFLLFFTGILVQISVLWFVSLRLLTHPRKVTKE